MTPRGYAVAAAIVSAALVRPAVPHGAMAASSSPGRGAEATSSLSVGCAGCHEDEFAAWRGSRHAVAFTNALFRAEWGARRQPWCAGCHAPSAPEPARDLDPRANDGVGCAACHVRDERLVSASRSPASPHDTRVDPDFGSPDFCAGCHEFSFPVLDSAGRNVGSTGVAMQATASEVHNALGGRAQCVGCHMPRGGAGHRFPGAHDPDMLRRAVSLAACRRAGKLELDVTNENPAHRLPTGGVNRHLLVRAWRSSRPSALFEARIGRRFEPAPGGGKRVVADTTLGAGASRRFAVSLASLGPAAEPLNLAIRYVYAHDRRHAGLAARDRARTIARRRVPPADLPACE